MILFQLLGDVVKDIYAYRNDLSVLHSFKILIVIILNNLLTCASKCMLIVVAIIWPFFPS